ncbi:hypothetical protein F2Q69_00056128 [Brassica cretica]|uniref:Uncharacterized protein n=1 Tax=Brassica cretica TaxID=69181 RepID=A0A8S9MQB1_BRACR|nr:hypothetical protein F2Q69_00056128 [Brassica cretica]
MPRVAMIEFRKENTRKAKITLRRTKSVTTAPPPRELPCYITSFLTIVILSVGLNAKSWMVYQPQPPPSSDSSPSPSDRFGSHITGDAIEQSEPRD